MPFRRLLFLLLFCCPVQAAIVHGTVTNALGIPVLHANVVLLQNGKILALALTRLDGTYQFSTSASGRFYVLTSAKNFKQITSLSFYAGIADSHEENIVLESANANHELVASATGLPTAEPQVSPEVELERSTVFRNRVDLTDPLRQMPGTFVVRQGQYGGLASLFLRGANSSANQINLDGVPIGEIGGAFDFSNLSSSGIGDFEVYRGPNSVLYGTDAAASSIDLRSLRGSTSFPSFFYEGDAGTFTTFRNQAQLGGTYKRLDYYGGFEALQSDNSIRMDEYHDDTASANLGYALSSATQLRVSVHNNDAATGTPGAFLFYGIANAGKRSDQDTYLAASIERRTYSGWHNLLRYDLSRKREQDVSFYPAGLQLADTGNYYGYNTVIRGANGFSMAGQAILNFPGTFPNEIEHVTNRDRLYFQSDYPFSSHIAGLFTFRYEDERGARKSVAFDLDQTLDRRNYDYTGQIQGDYHHRVFYSLGGGVEKNGLFGTQGTPRLGIAYYPVRPGKGIAHGTRIHANFAKGYQEPSLDQQFASLYNFLEGQAAIAQFHVQPLVEQQSRTYDGGVVQSFLNERLALRISYFHSEYGRQIENVPAAEVPALLPQLDAAQRQELESLLSASGGLDVNSQAFQAQGIESQVDFLLWRRLSLHGGYTYLDAVVQRSFTSDALQPVFNPAVSSLPIGAFSPLRGARPFERPPHTGFAAANYTGRNFSAMLTAAVASRSDDSTFLGGRDFLGGNSLLLPNRNLDYGYTKLDVGGSYQVLDWLAIYTQLDNLTSNKRIAPLGYPSLPFTFRLGLRVSLGHASGK